MRENHFAKGVEKLINPVDVGTIHFIQQFNNFIPKSVQEKMVKASGAKTPYMGFVVEPYSYFLCYEIKDVEKAKTLLPKGYRLTKTSIFNDDQKKYYGILGCFRAHTSGFWGFRVEFYVIAENESTGLLSWIIIDYDTNTITYDEKNLLQNPNSKDSVMTIDYDGVLYVDIKNNMGRELIFHSKIDGESKNLDHRLWVEGNLSIVYGPMKSKEKSQPFSLMFNPDEFKEALSIPCKNLQLMSNSWFKDLLEDEPSQLVCFPYAQHFLSDSPGRFSSVSVEELDQMVEEMDFDAINVFSTETFKKQFLLGGLFSALINILLIILLIVT